MDWGSLLTILKFAGTLLSGFGAIVAAIPDSRRSKRSGKSKLTRVWRRIVAKESGLYIAIIGLVVAVISQFIEDKLDNQKDAKNKQNSDRVLRNILRLETRFDYIKVEITCICGLRDDSVNKLCSSSFLSEAEANTNGFNTQTDTVYSANIVGYTVLTNSGNEVKIQNTMFFGKESTVDLNTFAGFETNWISSGVSEKNIRDVKSILENPELAICFCNQTDEISNPDYYYILESTNTPTEVSYNPINHSVKVKWSLYLSGIQNLGNNYASLSELPSQYIGLTISDRDIQGDNWVNQIISLRECSINLGSFSYTINDTNIVYLPDSDHSFWHTVYFPCPYKALLE